jgi:DNA-binding CsgD family transcriptional regulator
VSADLREIVEQDPSAWVGLSILDMVHPDDGAGLADLTLWRSPRRRIRLRHGVGGWVEVCILFAPVGAESHEIAFAVVGAPGLEPAQTIRVAELVLYLRRIGAEVRASGVLNEFGDPSAPNDLPQLGELTSRQWEILNRILRGERAATIAHALYLSPSTVRNHLSVIFRKFEVHSQVELIQKIRPLPESYGRPV